MTEEERSGKDDSMRERKRFVTILTIVVILSSSLLGLWLTYTAGISMWISYAGFTFNAIFSLFLWQGKSWAKTWLLGRYLATFAFAILLFFVLGDPLGGLFEVLASACAITLLVGFPSMQRAYVALTLYVVLLTGFGAFFVSFTQAKKERTQIVSVAQRVPHYSSEHKYEVAMEELPWRVLSSGQAEEILGDDIPGADLRLVRRDGSSFGLFFPLQFANTPFSEELTILLQQQIQQKWLADLKKWKEIELEDGFILTAEGKMNGTSAAYTVLYKHFGNLGVYAVFWTDLRHKRRLLSEVEIFYENTTAPPIKERLPTYTPAQIYRNNSESVVLLNVYDKEGKLVGKGSGFNISEEGMIITNLHVILAGNSLEVVFPKSGEFSEVEIVGLTPPQYDLALLSVKGEHLPQIRSFKSVPVVPGDIVYVLGNPKGLVNSLSQGIIGAVRDGGELTLYQITAPISPGSSGGPVFSEFGEVIGVANSVVIDAQNLNFSISIDELQNLYLFQEPMTLETLIEKIQ